MELARELRTREDETSILFITGSTEFLRDGYSVRPIQYLLKPVEPEALRRAIETDLRLHHRPHSVTFCAGGRTLYLTDGTDLTIGRRYMDQFKNRFVRYLNQD